MTRVSCLVISLLVLCLTADLAAQLPDVMYLRFNEGTGTTTTDFAVPGIGTSCSFQSTAGFDTSNPALGFACFKAATLNPFSQVNTNATVALSGDWTLEFHCYFAGGTTLPNPSILHDGTSNGLKAIVLSTPGAPNFAVTLRSDTGGHQVNLANVLPVNTWTQFAFVHTAANNTITSYVNGVLKQTDVFSSPATLTSSGPLYVGGEPVTSTFNGMIDELRIWNTARSGSQIAANYNQEIAGYTDNIQAGPITAPVNPSAPCTLLGSAETVTLSVTNTGSNTVAAGTTITMDLVIDGAPPLNEFIVVPAGGLVAGASLGYTFAALVDLSIPGSHQIDVTVGLVGDQNPADDVASLTVLSGGTAWIASYPWTENFDGLISGTTTPPVGWTQETSDSSGANSDWIFLMGQAATTTTSPLGDHTGGGLYAYVEDSATSLANVSLRSPCLALGTLTMPGLSFWFHNQDASGGINTNPMSVDVIVQPAGVVTSDVFGPEGDIGNGWMPRTVDLSAFAGQFIQIVFRGRSDGGAGNCDTAIDDLVVFDLVPGNGQAPQAGLAVFDLNAATEANGLPVSSFLPGPYATTATAGGPLDFDFVGEPNRPFLFIIGPLNPVAATYGVVGQLDIGGPVDPMTGVPVSLQVLGDGFNPVDFFDLFFFTGATGSANLDFQLPALPTGLLGAFQALFSTGNGNFFAISNAIALTIN